MSEQYWVTFRIATDATYQKRYNALVKAMTEARGSNGSWGEPTSFWLVGSDLDIDSFTEKLAAALNPTTDLLLVRYLSRDSSRYFGTTAHADTLKSFLPLAKKIT